GCNLIQRWIAEERCQILHAGQVSAIISPPRGMFTEISVQQFRQRPLLFFGLVKESPFDDLDFDLSENGFGEPLVRRPCASPHLLALVHKRHPPCSTSLHESHPFTPFQWDSVLWFPRGRKYRPRVSRSQSVAPRQYGPFCMSEFW